MWKLCVLSRVLAGVKVIISLFTYVCEKMLVFGQLAGQHLLSTTSLLLSKGPFHSQYFDIYWFTGLSRKSTHNYTALLKLNKLNIFWALWHLKATTGILSCLEGEGEVRAIQLQHANLPINTTHWTFKCKPPVHICTPSSLHCYWNLSKC